MNICWLLLCSDWARFLLLFLLNAGRRVAGIRRHVRLLRLWEQSQVRKNGVYSNQFGLPAKQPAINKLVPAGLPSMSLLATDAPKLDRKARTEPNKEESRAGNNRTGQRRNLFQAAVM